jgi:hypothetical protein
LKNCGNMFQIRLGTDFGKCHIRMYFLTHSVPILFPHSNERTKGIKRPVAGIFIRQKTYIPPYKSTYSFIKIYLIYSPPPPSNI